MEGDAEYLDRVYGAEVASELELLRIRREKIILSVVESNMRVILVDRPVSTFRMDTSGRFEAKLSHYFYWSICAFFGVVGIVFLWYVGR